MDSAKGTDNIYKQIKGILYSMEDKDYAYIITPKGLNVVIMMSSKARQMSAGSLSFSSLLTLTLNLPLV